MKGSIIGNAATPVFIAARGQAVQTATDLAIGNITIGGRVEFANFLAGYSFAALAPNTLLGTNGDAQIGIVKVTGTWAASNLVAGATNTSPTAFGDGNDASIGAGTVAIKSSITSITISGGIFGTPNSLSSADHFGFVAEKIGSIKIGTVTVALSAAPDTDNIPLGPDGDVNLHEV